MSTTAKVFISTALGSAIGTLIALQFGVFWFLGVIIGGAVGYLSYEYQQVIEAIQDARETVILPKLTDVRKDLREACLAMPARVTRLTKRFCFVLFGFTGILTLINLFYGAIFLGIEKSWNQVVSNLMTAVSIVGIFIASLSLIEALSNRTDEQLSEFAREWNIFAWLIALLRGVKHGISFLWSHSGSWLRLLCRLSKQVFATIHSEIRLLCGVDAMIGATIGYQWNNPLIGALVGGLLGVLNFELISKRFYLVKDH